MDIVDILATAQRSLLTLRADVASSDHRPSAEEIAVRLDQIVAMVASAADILAPAETPEAPGTAPFQLNQSIIATHPRMIHSPEVEEDFRAAMDEAVDLGGTVRQE